MIATLASAISSTAGITGSVYISLISLASVVAIFTRSTARRKAALDVLFVLMWRRRGK